MLSRTSKLILVVALVAGSLAMAAPGRKCGPDQAVKMASGDRRQPGNGPSVQTERQGNHQVKEPHREGT